MFIEFFYFLKERLPVLIIEYMALLIGGIVNWLFILFSSL